jgi:hypothetical protein
LTILQALHVIPVSFFAAIAVLDLGITPVFIYAIADAALLMLGYPAFFHDAPHISILIQPYFSNMIRLTIKFPIATAHYYVSSA